MSKIMIMPSNKDIEDTFSYVDSYLLGLKNYSVNIPLSLTIDEIEIMSKKLKEKNKELFISINKNIYTEELEYLKKILLKLDKLDIKGLFFADVALVNLKKELNLKMNLVWSSEHMITNYQTINTWSKYGVSYAYLSTDITLREIKEIIDKTKIKTVVCVFGYLPLFNSKRHEIKNYLDCFKLKDNSKINYIEKEDKEYIIIDDDTGTTVYSDKILNAYEELKDIKADYILLNSFNILNDEFKEVLKVFKEQKEKTFVFKNSDKGFLYKDTYYKVK